MSRVIALIPARGGSKGIPGKNFKPLAGRSPVNRAIDVAFEIREPVHVVLSGDGIENHITWTNRDSHPALIWIARPAELSTDTTSMNDVVRHALCGLDGDPYQIVVLLQPTQPLRQARHVDAAIDMLTSTCAESIVSVVQTESPERMYRINDERLVPWNGISVERRQDAAIAYKRDGTVYAFWRQTFNYHGNIYGEDCRPLIIPASESCSLDTMDDWAEAERRLREREHAAV